MSKTELMKPEILRGRILEIMALRRFMQDPDGLKTRIDSIDRLLSRDVSDGKRASHLKETQDAILGLAEYGYPNQALSYISIFTTMYEELPNDTILTTG